MAPNYPDLPDSPSKDSKKNKTSSNKKQSSSPLSTTSSVENEPEDFEKYEVRRAAVGTGIFSSLFTLATVTLHCYHFPPIYLIFSFFLAHIHQRNPILPLLQGLLVSESFPQLFVQCWFRHQSVPFDCDWRSSFRPVVSFAGQQDFEVISLDYSNHLTAIHAPLP